jgi:hypothetical protein
LTGQHIRPNTQQDKRIDTTVDFDHSPEQAALRRLRRVGNALSLLYYAGWSWSRQPQEFAVTANALRLLADDAPCYAARQAIFIHEAIGTTWGHDLSLYCLASRTVAARGG